MPADARIRLAAAADAETVARIGREAVPLQYEGLVDPAAVRAAIEQIYTPEAVADCIARCAAVEDALFLVAELEGRLAAFLHFDAFGPEPELHRLYADPDVRSRGVGGLLMRTLHDRLPGTPYMLLVVEGNHGAVRFYERHGLCPDRLVDGLAFYRERMGVEFPRGTRPFRLLVMRRRPASESQPGTS